MNGHVVTSFSPEGYERYGKRFIESYLSRWTWPLYVFAEGQPMPRAYLGTLHWHDLKDDEEHEAFCKRNAGKDSKTDFNEMPVRFGHKVFAVTSPRLPRDGWRVWVDADVEFHGEVTDEVLAQLFPSDKTLTFLGREGFMRPGQPAYTECGFVGYNLDDVDGQIVLEKMRDAFAEDEVLQFGRHNKHDSYTFDRVKGLYTGGPDTWNNLSAHCRPGTMHVWPHTILSRFSSHQKGPKRKKAHYGF